MHAAACRELKYADEPQESTDKVADNSTAAGGDFVTVPPSKGASTMQVGGTSRARLELQA